MIEEFIGIVRGRKPGSSRGQVQPAPKRTAREKALAKQAARPAAGKRSPVGRVRKSDVSLDARRSPVMYQAGSAKDCRILSKSAVKPFHKATELSALTPKAFPPLTA